MPSRSTRQPEKRFRLPAALRCLARLRLRDPRVRRLLKPTHIQGCADEVWAEARLRRVTLHECRHGYKSCRHGYKSFLEDAGISEARCDRYMGHASKNVGRSYSHRIAGQLNADAQQLDAYLTGTAASVTVLRPWGNSTGATTGAHGLPSRREAHRWPRSGLAARSFPS